MYFFKELISSLNFIFHTLVPLCYGATTENNGIFMCFQTMNRSQYSIDCTRNTKLEIQQMMMSSSKCYKMIWNGPSTGYTYRSPKSGTYVPLPNILCPWSKPSSSHFESISYRAALSSDIFLLASKLKSVISQNRKKTHHNNEPNHQNNSHLILLAAKYIAIEPMP
jgi:hypothetical protein